MSKEKLIQFFSITYCEYCFHYTCAKSCPRDWSDQCLILDKDESILHLLNTQAFPSSAAFSFSGCPAQVEGMKTTKTNCLFNS